MLHPGSDERSLRNKKRNSLPLHVRSHQRAVGVIVLEERNERRRYRHDLLRRYVHVVYTVARHRKDVVGLLVITDDNHFVSEGTVFVEFGVRLGNDVVILFVCSQVIDLIRDFTALRIHPTVRSFDEAILVDACKRRQGVDQTDVRPLRCLDRTHTAIVTVVNVPHLKARALTRQTARSECRQTTFVRQFRQRVRLIHELGQLGAAEELFDRCDNRTDVDQRLRRNHVCILDRHSLANNAFHPGQTDTELILEQFAHGTQTTVTQVIDIIRIADSMQQVDEVADGGNDIRLRNMLHGFIDVCVRDDLHDFSVLDRREYVDRLQRDILAVHHAAGNMIILEAYALLKVRHNLVQKTTVYGLTGFRNDLTRIDVYQTFCQTLIKETVLNMKLLIDLVTTNVSQIITLRIEETRNEKTLRILQCWRLARAKAFIDFNERFFRGVRVVFIQRILNIFIIAQKIQNLGICAKTKCT
ncbi:Uncharacterised protein [Actinobacillus pleuropneumoniae]|nr:Uncharacterised protein [Actinobacillus pleuropneumoniae]